MTTTDYVLSITVPYDEVIHGTYKLDNFNSNYDMESLKYGYLCIHSIPLDEFYNNEIFKQWCHYSSEFSQYNTIKTCIEIVKKNKIKLIDSTIDENERYVTTSIIKTHYIKLIQRKWKKLYKQMIMNKGNLINLRYREIHGKWPNKMTNIL